MGTLAPVRNVLKAWLVLVALCAIMGLIGYGIGGVQIASSFVFCGVLLGIAAYVSLERVVLVVAHGGTLRRVQEAALGEAAPVVANCGLWAVAVEDGKFRAID